ncbi:MAG TPA: 2-C-methyl-D-erythritol 4-phosphate cytidylyltransferase [Planctomycetes bacterium]|nr:2-C-methyl-D-erythritol 4-phosphate cytidylyltransferase [Planctomycetota bacterium]
MASASDPPAVPPRARAVLVAAGRSTRLGGTIRKPLIELAGRPLLAHTLDRFAAARTVASIVIVAHGDDLAAVRELAAASPAAAKLVAVVPGGAERTDSVRAGVLAPAPAGDPLPLVAIHDAARPFVTPGAIDRVNEAAACDGAAILAIPLRDTIKRSTDGRTTRETLDRSGLFGAQTPQSFHAEPFARLLERALTDDFRPTDDAALWERYLGAVTLVPGEAANYKVTDAADLERARLDLASPTP